MNQFIMTAIANRKILELTYSGFVRVVEPHAYGVNEKGEEILRCFQTAGGSSSGASVDWKLLTLGDARAVRESGNTFTQARVGYRRGDRAMYRIYAEL